MEKCNVGGGCRILGGRFSIPLAEGYSSYAPASEVCDSIRAPMPALHQADRSIAQIVSLLGAVGMCFSPNSASALHRRCVHRAPIGERQPWRASVYRAPQPPRRIGPRVEIVVKLYSATYDAPITGASRTRCGVQANRCGAPNLFRKRRDLKRTGNGPGVRV
jgi:hypothetical protein